MLNASVQHCNPTTKTVFNPLTVSQETPHVIKGKGAYIGRLRELSPDVDELIL